MHWYAGTSGYSYTAWKGSFYPEDLAADAMLGYYATRLPAVEINNTFYRMPRSNVLENWAAAVPTVFVSSSRRPAASPICSVSRRWTNPPATCSTEWPCSAIGWGQSCFSYRRICRGIAIVWPLSWTC